MLFRCREVLLIGTIIKRNCVTERNIYIMTTATTVLHLSADTLLRILDCIIDQLRFCRSNEQLFDYPLSIVLCPSFQQFIINNIGYSVNSATNIYFATINR